MPLNTPSALPALSTRSSRSIFTLSLSILAFMSMGQPGAQAFTAETHPGLNPAQLRTLNEEANATYDRVIPYYIEACATSAYHPLKGESGGSFGHGMLMIHGACRDASNPRGPQQIKFCSENPDSTIGISTDAQYHNTQWTVVDTRSGMLYGDHPADQAFTPEKRLELIERSLRSGVYHNVIAKPWNQREADQMGLSLNQWIAQFGLGTDYALTMARGVSCTRIPLVGGKKGQEKGPLLAVIRYLNDLNKMAWDAANGPQKTGYQYEYLVNNCTHPTANALAAVGLLHERDTHLPGPSSTLEKWRRQRDFAAPFNVMFETYKESTVRRRIKDIVNHLRQNPKALAALRNWGWLGTQAGVIIEDLPSHNFENSVFHTEISRSFFSMKSHAQESLNSYSEKLFNLKVVDVKDVELAQFTQALRIPEVVELAANLRKWRETYSTLLREPQLSNGGEIESLLKEYLETKQKENDERLDRLAQR